MRESAICRVKNYPKIYRRLTLLKPMKMMNSKKIEAGSTSTQIKIPIFLEWMFPISHRNFISEAATFLSKKI